VELKELIAIQNIAASLKVPAKTDRKMGHNKNAWCEFHQANGHYIRNCLALAQQLDELVKSGFLKDYLQKPQTDQELVIAEADQGHNDGDQDQEEIEANIQGQEEVEAQVVDAQRVISPPHRLTRSKFKELGNSGRLFSLFIISFVSKGA